MFALLSPRLWMLVGLAVALVAAFLAGVKTESNRRDAQLLKQERAYQEQLAALRDTQEKVQEQISRALDTERTRNQDLSLELQQAIGRVDAQHNAIKVNCTPKGSNRPAVILANGTSPPKDPVLPAQQPGQAIALPGSSAGSDVTTPVSAPVPASEATDETVDVSLDDPIFYADFIRLYNVAVTRQPEGLSQGTAGAHGGDPPAGPASGRDLIDNVDENGKRFAECREKLKSWQAWARGVGLAN